MENTELRSILCQIPKAERDSAEKRIRTAEDLGWADVGLWQWLDKAELTEVDMTGVDPQGKFRFIP